MKSPNIIASAISLAVRLAPTFANEDGELIFKDLRREFPALTEDQADLIVTRACINAKAGFKAVGWPLFSERLLCELMGWGVNDPDFSDDAPLSPREELTEGEAIAGLL